MSRKSRGRTPALRLKRRLISVFALISLIPTVSLVFVSLLIIYQSSDRWENISAELRELRVLPMSEKALGIASDQRLIQMLQDGTLPTEMDFGLSENHTVIIYGSDGRLLLSTSDEPMPGVKLDSLREAGLPPIHRFHPWEPVVPEEIEVKNKELALSAAVCQSPDDGTPLGVVAVGKVRPAMAADIGMEAIIAIMTLAGIFVFLIALWISSMIAREISDPIHKLVAGTQEVADGNLDYQVNIDARDEVGILADSFNLMTTKLRDYAAELRQVEKSAAWREVAQKLAHEIKNPLTPIQLSAERLQRRYKSNREGYEEILSECTQTIVDEVERLRRLLDEFSRLARMPKIDPIPSDINRIVDKALRIYGEVPDSVEIITEYAENMPLISVDPEQMERAIFNIIKNAVEAMNNSGKLAIKTQLVTNSDNEFIEIKITDTGPGISKQSMDKLFTPHFSTKRGGAGLGLAIVKKIITDHGGDVTAKNEEDRGTTLDITIPIVEGADKSE